MCAMKNDGMIEDICRLIAIESISGAPEDDFPFGEKPYRALQECLEICKRLGMRTKLCGKYTGYAEIGSGSRLVGALAHLDVVPAGNGWETDPFTGTVKGGRLYGRGALDDKGPAMAAVYAMKDLLDGGIELNKRIRIIFGCSEEVGEWTDIEYYKNTEELLEAGFTPDADFPLIYAEKGIAEFLVTIAETDGGITAIAGGDAVNMVPAHCQASVTASDGTTITVEKEGRSAHGSTPEEGINAIGLVMQEIAEMNFHGKCHSAFADFYMAKIGLTTDGSLADCSMEDEVSGALTMNPGLISKEGNNILLRLDVRYPVTCTAEDVLEKLQTGLGPSAQVEMAYNELPMFIDPNSHLVQTLLSVYREVTGDMTEPMTMGGGTYARAMKNIAAFGPVFPGRPCTEHQSNEYVEIEDLYRAREIYRLAMERM